MIVCRELAYAIMFYMHFYSVVQKADQNAFALHMPSTHLNAAWWEEPPTPGNSDVAIAKLGFTHPQTCTVYN